MKWRRRWNRKRSRITARWRAWAVKRAEVWGLGIEVGEAFDTFKEMKPNPERRAVAAIWEWDC